MFILTLFERISYLAKKRDKSIKEVAEELGLSRNAIYQWKTSSPKADTLQKVAEYFDVSVDYLLGREEKTSLSEKYGVFAFDGEPVSDEEVEFLKAVLAAKRAAENK